MDWALGGAGEAAAQRSSEDGWGVLNAVDTCWLQQRQSARVHTYTCTWEEREYGEKGSQGKMPNIPREKLRHRTIGTKSLRCFGEGFLLKSVSKNKQNHLHVEVKFRDILLSKAVVLLSKAMAVLLPREHLTIWRHFWMSQLGSGGGC